MPIIPPVNDESAPDELIAIFRAAEQRSGSSNMMRTIAHSPQLLREFYRFYMAIWGGKSDPKLKEKIRFRVAIAGQCRYRQCARTERVRQMGLTEEELMKVKSYDESDLQTAERPVLRLVDQMVENNLEERNAIYQKLRAYFTEEEIVELTLSIGFFLGIGRMNRFLDIQFQPRS